MLLSALKDFVPVIVDRDRAPQLVQRLHVSSYPSLLVLGDEQENLHRWSGYSSTARFLEHLERARRADARYRAGEAWLERPARAADLGTRTLRTIPVPQDDTVEDLVWHRGELWLLQRQSLVCIDPKSGQTLRSLSLQDLQIPDSKPGSLLLNGITSDGTRLCMVPYGWTKGDPIVRFDPGRSNGVTGTAPAAEILVTQANLDERASAAFALAIAAGRLWVGHHGRKLSVVSPEDGSIERVLLARSNEFEVIGFAGLCASEDRLLAISRIRRIPQQPTVDFVVYDLPIEYALLEIDPASGVAQERFVFPFPVAGLALDTEGHAWTAEEIERDYDEQHRFTRTGPLALHLFEFRLEQRP